ncbi:MAG: hypothetical protein M3Z10_07450 [Gemmatimonadota bacterium]|nr:hypothetical protein [Gemmatimonadota bacterium]
MFVAVEHEIKDPERFWAKAQEIVPNLPSNVKLHHCFPTKDGSRGICVWEGESVVAVKTYLEAKVGDVSSNDYFEVENKEAIALPSQIRVTASRNT